MLGKEFEDLLNKVGGNRIAQMVEIFKDDPKALEHFLEETAKEAIPDDSNETLREKFLEMLKGRFVLPKPAGGVVKAPEPVPVPAHSDED